jgi:hypothetical protein
MIDEKDVKNMVVFHMKAVIDLIDSHRIDPEELAEYLSEEADNADTDWQSELWTDVIRYIYNEDYSEVEFKH